MEQTRYTTGSAPGKTSASAMINAPSKTQIPVTNDPGTNQSRRHMNRSTSDGSPTTYSAVKKRRDRVFSMASKETSQAFKKKKSSSFPSETGVLPRPDPMMGDTGSSSSITGRPRLASESHENMDHSTIKLLQNLTSLIVCARSTSLLPHTSTASTSSTTVTTEGAQAQSGPPPSTTIPTTNLPRTKPEHHQSTRSSSLHDDSLQVEAMTTGSADIHPVPDSSDFYDSPLLDGGSEETSMEVCQQPVSIRAQVLESTTTTTHQALSRYPNKKSNTKEEGREAGFSSTTMVSCPPEKKKMDRSGTTLLPFGECVSSGGGGGSLVNPIIRIQGLVNTITNSNKLESRYSDLCLPTDHLEQQQQQQQKTTKKANETKTLKLLTNPTTTTTGLATDKTQKWLCEAGELNRAGSDYCCQGPQPTPTNTPQEFNQERPQEFNQRSLPAAPLEGCSSTESSNNSNKELCPRAPGHSSSAPLSLREESGRIEVENLQSLKKLQQSCSSGTAVAASSASFSPQESLLDTEERVESSQEVCPVAVDCGAVALSLPTFKERFPVKGDSKVDPCSSVTTTGAATPHLSLSHSKERFVESGGSEINHSRTDKGVHSTTTIARGGTVPPVSLSEHSKERLSSTGEVGHSVKTDSNKEKPCSTAAAATIGTGSLPGSNSSTILGKGGEEYLEARKEELELHCIPIVAATSPSLSKEEGEKSDTKGEVPVAGCLETNHERFSVAFLLSDSTGQVKASPASAVSEQQSALPPAHLTTGSDDSGAVLNLTLQEVNNFMSCHLTEKRAKPGHSYDGDIINDSQSISDPQLVVELDRRSNESNRTESIAGQCQPSDQRDISDSIGEPSQLQQEGEEREAGMSDSEGTLSAMSDEEQGASQQNGEVSKKKSSTSLTQRRRKKRLHSSSERRSSSSKRGDMGTSGAPPGFSSTSERVNQEVAMKATRARKLLAKSKAAVSLRQRQKRREAELGGESASETEFRRSSRPSSLRRGGGEREMEVGEEGEGEETSAGQDTSQREGVRKSQRIVKGKRMLYVSEDEASDEEEFSPTPAKRRKRSSPRGHSHPYGSGTTDSSHHPAGQPLMGDFLATILTDIPEVDICPLSSFSTNPPSTSVNGATPQGHHRKKSDIGSPSSSQRVKSPRATTRRRTSARQSSLDRVAESPRNSPQQPTDNKRRGVLPHLYNLQSSQDRSSSSRSPSKCPSPEVGLQNTSGAGGRSRRKSGGGGTPSRQGGSGGGTGETSSSQTSPDDRVLQDSEESRTHYRVLMSWETDYLRGTKATRGPILYAMEKVRDQLDSIEGPWMNKAKFIWTTWRHRVSPKVRSIYSKRAKENRKELYGKNKVILNIRHPAPKVTTSHRQSMRTIKTTASQQLKKRQDRASQRSQPRPRPRSRSRVSSTRKQPRKQSRSADLGSKSKKSGSKVAQPPSPGAEVNTVNSGGEDESNNAENNVSDCKADDQVTSVSIGASDQQEISRSVSKSNTTRQSSRSHTPLPDQQAQLSTVDSIKWKPVSDSTGSSPNPVAPPTSRPSTPPVCTILTRSQKRQSIQFTENSLKVSFKRTPSLSPPPPAPTPVSISTPVPSVQSTSPDTSTKTVKRSTGPGKKEASTDSSRGMESDMPSSQQLAEFFSSMTPLSAPVSPKRNQPPSSNLSFSTNGQVSQSSSIHVPCTAPSSSPLPPRSNANASAPVYTTTSRPLLSRSSAKNDITPSALQFDASSSTTSSVYGALIPPHSNTNANSPNKIRSVPHSSTTSSSSNMIGAPLHVPPYSSARVLSTPCSMNTPLFSNLSTSSRPHGATTRPPLPYSNAPALISTPNSINVTPTSILGASTKSSSATNRRQSPRSSITTYVPNSTVSSVGTSFSMATMPQVSHSNVKTSTPNPINAPLISSIGANTPNSTNTPPSSDLHNHTSLISATVPQVSHSSASTVPHISTSMPLGTKNMPLVSNHGTLMTATNTSQVPRSIATAVGAPSETNTPSISNLGMCSSAPIAGSTITPLNSSNLGTSSKSSDPTLSSSSPNLSSPTAHSCSITTQARLTSEPSTSASASVPITQSERWRQPGERSLKGKTEPPKPTISSIYQQLLADKKIKPSKSGAAGKKPPRKKKPAPSLPPHTSTVAGPGGTGITSKGLTSEKGTKKSIKQGLSSKLSSPLCTTFPTFVIPHMPMGGSGGGTDPNLLVSPVWLGHSSFSGLMSTMPYHTPPSSATPPIAPPTATPTSSSGSTTMDNPWSQGLLSSSTQALPASASNNPLKLSKTSVDSQVASSQQSPTLFGFSSEQQFGSLRAPNYSGLPTFPVQLNPPVNNSGPEVSSSGSSEKTPPCSSATSSKTATKNANNEKQKTTAKSGRKRPSKLISSTSKAAKKGSTPTSQTTPSTVSSSLESSRPHIDMYPDSPPAANRQTSKTLQYRPVNESSHNSTMKSPSTPQHSFPNPRSLSTSSSTPMSPPTHIPTNKSGRFRFPSISSPLTLPLSLPSTTFSSLTTMLESPTAVVSSSTSAASILSPSALSSPSLTAQSLVVVGSGAASSPSSGKVQDVNSLEYRKLILKRVQQWNEHKQKMMQLQGRTDSILKSPPVFYDGSMLSPTSDDTGQLASGSVNFSPNLRSALMSSPTDAPGSTSNFKVAVSLPNAASGECSPTSMILGLGSPKLLTVGPPVTFADTLAPRPNSNSNPPSSLGPKSPSTTSAPVTHSSPDLKSPSLTSSLVTSPTVVPSVVGSAIQMDDILAASYGCTMVAPSVVFNSSFMGDLSSMSRWELEQLYKHNMEKLEQQKKFISILEAQLKQVRDQHDCLSTQKPSQSEVYKRFLSFVVEPKLIPDVSSICSDKFGYEHLSKETNGAKTKPTLDFNEVIKGGTFDRPVLNEKYDFYANFGRS